MVRVRLGVFMTVCAMVLTSAVGAWPGAVPKSVRGGVTMSAAALRVGRSVGSPTTGHLLGGARLEETPYLRVVPTYASSDVRWGLASLVAMIDRAGRQVRRKYPDAVLSVGHISRRGGGEVDRHASHESGRDADIGFYVKNHLGRPTLAEQFVAFRGDGTAPTWPGARFDDERNWLLMTALVTDPGARVSHIFVAAPLRARLLAHANRIGAPASVRSRAAELMVQPRGALPHDDHFHVRITCPGGMHECIEFPLRKREPAYARIPLPHGRGRATVAAKKPPKPAPVPVKESPRPRELPPPSSEPPTSATPAPEDFSFEPPPAVLSTPIDDADGEL